jgi:hypothetical protein
MPLKYSDKPLSLADSTGVFPLAGEKLQKALLDEVTRCNGTLDLSLNGFYMGVGKLGAIVNYIPWSKVRGLKLSNSMLDDDDMMDLQASLKVDANVLEELYIDYNSGLSQLDKYQLESFFSALPKGLKLLNLEGTWLQKADVLEAIKESHYSPDSLTICLDGKRLDISKKTQLSQTKPSDFEKRLSEDASARSSPPSSLPGSPVLSGKPEQLDIKPAAKVVLHGRRAGTVPSDAERRRSRDNSDDEAQQLGDSSGPKSKGVITHGRRAQATHSSRLFSSKAASTDKSSKTPESDSTSIPDGPSTS